MRRQQLRDAFNLFDADGSGDLDLSEVAILVTAFGRDAASAEAVFAEFDIDGSGRIDFVEFISMMKTIDSAGHPDAIRESWRAVGMRMRLQKLPVERRIALKVQMSKASAAVRRTTPEDAADEEIAAAATAPEAAAGPHGAPKSAPAVERASADADTPFADAVVAAAAAKLATSKDEQKRAVGVAVGVLARQLSARDAEIAALRAEVRSLRGNVQRYAAVQTAVERAVDAQAVERAAASAAAAAAARVTPPSTPRRDGERSSLARCEQKRNEECSSSLARDGYLATLLLDAAGAGRGARPAAPVRRSESGSAVVSDAGEGASPSKRGSPARASSVLRQSPVQPRPTSRLALPRVTAVRRADTGAFAATAAADGAPRLSPIRARTTTTTTTVATMATRFGRFTSPCADDAEPEARAKLLAWMERASPAGAAVAGWNAPPPRALGNGALAALRGD
jgi:hypothetical protein